MMNFTKIVLDNKIYINEYIPSIVNKILVFSHGLGGSKENVERYIKILNDNNIGVISYDGPCQGEDKTPNNKYFFKQCIAYLDRVVEYTKIKYNKELYLVGTSYGGFIVLSYLLNNNYKSILINPAINMYDILKSTFPYDLYEESINNIKDKQELISKHKYNNISIIQGNNDSIVNYKDVEEFCNRNNLLLNIIDGGEHELFNYVDKVSDYIVRGILDEEKV